MTTLELAIKLQALVVLSLTSIVWLKLIPMQRLDQLRQDLFELRDEMFDYALAGQISFDDPAYMLLRSQMNGFIRFGHQVTLFRLIMSDLSRRMNAKPVSATWNHQWSLSIDGVKSEGVRREMIRFHERAVSLVAKHLIRGSVLLCLLVGLAVITGTVSEGIVSLKQAVRRARNKVLSGPIDPRVIEEQAFCAS